MMVASHFMKTALVHERRRGCSVCTSAHLCVCVCACLCSCQRRLPLPFGSAACKFTLTNTAQLSLRRLWAIRNSIKISSRDLGGCVKKLFCLLEFIERTSARIYVWECFFCPVVIGNCLCQLLSAKCHSVFPLLWKHLPLQPLTS